MQPPTCPQRTQRLGTELGLAANPRTFLHAHVYRSQSVPRWCICCLGFFLCLLTTSLLLLCLCPHLQHHHYFLLVQRLPLWAWKKPSPPRQGPCCFCLTSTRPKSLGASLRVDEFPVRQVGHSLLILYGQRCPLLDLSRDSSSVHTLTLPQKHPACGGWGWEWDQSEVNTEGF